VHYYINQNPLQKGFTENSSPLLCELLVEEFERENKDLKRPTYIAMLDAKSAFDVVVHDATSSAQVGAQTLIFPIFPPNPESSRKFRRGLIYSLYRSALKTPPCRTYCSISCDFTLQ
jgi:hypothetical protein